MKNTNKAPYTKSTERLATGGFEVTYEGDGWKGVGRALDFLDASNAAADEARKVAPAWVMNKIDCGLAALGDKRTAREMSDVEREAHDNL